MENPSITLTSSAWPREPADPLLDADLALRARTDAAAFAELYRRHINQVYRYLLVRTGSRADAEDLTEETFLAALEGIAGYRGQGPFAAWLIGIARHKAARHHRQARWTRPLDAADHIAHPDPSPEVNAEQKLALECVAQALRALSPVRAEALALRIFGDLSAGEVGQVMGKTEAAVKMLVQRAVQDLRARLAPEREVEL